jgi:XPB/Ssl2-like helicase family protein
MSLFNILVNAPHERLRRLANEFGISSASPSKRTILHELTRRYKDEGFISELLKGLPEESKRMIFGLVFFTPDIETIVIPRSLKKLCKKTCIMDDCLIHLFDVGLLFRDADGADDCVLLPEEIRRTLHSHYIVDFLKLAPQGEYELEGMSVHHPGLESVFHLACVVLHHRPVQTQKGMVHRKSIDRWAERLGNAALPDQFFEFVFEFCTARDFFTIHKNRIKITSAAGDWFNRDEKAIRNDIWAYYLETRIMPNPALQILLVVLRSIERFVKDDKKSPVFAISDFHTAWSGAVQETDSNVKCLDSLKWLSFLGLIQFNDVEMPTTFFLTRDGIEILLYMELPKEESHADRCVLQPNFDMLVPPSFRYPDLWKLEYLAEFKKRDIFTEYHFSQRSIMFGMRRGRKTDDTLNFIKNLTGDRIPDNIRYSIEEWCGKYGQITLKKTVLVECASVDLAEEMSHIPEISQMLEQRIADRYFIIAEPNAHQVMHILRDKGYEPAAIKRFTGEE